MASKYRQDRMDQSKPYTTYQSKSTTGQFFEEVGKRGEELRKQWTEAKPFEAGGSEEADKRGVRPMTVSLRGDFYKVNSPLQFPIIIVF